MTLYEEEIFVVAVGRQTDDHLACIVSCQLWQTIDACDGEYDIIISSVESIFQPLHWKKILTIHTIRADTCVDLFQQPSSNDGWRLDISSLLAFC